MPRCLKLLLHCTLRIRQISHTKVFWNFTTFILDFQKCKSDLDDLYLLIKCLIRPESTNCKPIILGCTLHMHLGFFSSAEQIVVVVFSAVGGANKFPSLRRGRGEAEAEAASA